MRILYAGFQVIQQESEDQANGVEPEHREGLDRFNDRLKSGDMESGRPTPPG